MNELEKAARQALEALRQIDEAMPFPVAKLAQAALREALAEQPAQQVVDSEEKAGAYMEARLWEFIDMAAARPKASPDPRTWDHVMVYAPKPAQQEPVAWVCEASSSDEKHAIDYWPGDVDDLPIGTKLYTSPPASKPWVGLTDEDIAAVRDSFGDEPVGLYAFARAAEAKLREKNA